MHNIAYLSIVANNFAAPSLPPIGIHRHCDRCYEQFESGVIAAIERECDRVEKGVRSLCGRTRGEEVRSHLVEFDNDGRSLLYFVEGDHFLVAMEMKGDRG